MISFWYSRTYITLEQKPESERTKYNYATVRYKLQSIYKFKIKQIKRIKKNMKHSGKIKK